MRLVGIQKLLNSEKFTDKKSGILLPIGVDDKDKIVFCDLKSTGGILVGGATGSGKSTFMYSTVTGLISNYSPEQVKFILIDSKRVEFHRYDKSEYLLTGVIHETEKARNALRWVLAEISHRFGEFGKERVITIDKYNSDSRHKLPLIFVLIDELSDLMYAERSFFEKNIAQIASIGQVAGVYIIVATSRPDPKHIFTPELRKAFRVKIAFQTASENDSRATIGKKGAEKLAGNGEMLYLCNGRINKLQGFFTESS